MTRPSEVRYHPGEEVAAVSYRESAAGSARSFARTGTQLLGGECQRLGGVLGPGEDDGAFGGVHPQRRPAGSFVRSQPGLPEKGRERIARGVERLLRPFEDAGLVSPGHGPGHGAAGAETSAFDHPLPDAEVPGDHIVRILRVNRADLLQHPLPGVVDSELDQLRTTPGEMMVDRPARRPGAREHFAGGHALEPPLRDQQPRRLDHRLAPTLRHARHCPRSILTSATRPRIMLCYIA